jgi:hypothetical protein
MTSQKEALIPFHATKSSLYTIDNARHETFSDFAGHSATFCNRKRRAEKPFDSLNKKQRIRLKTQTSITIEGYRKKSQQSELLFEDVTLEHFWAKQALFRQRRVWRSSVQKSRKMSAFGRRLKHFRIFSRLNAHNFHVFSGYIQLRHAVWTSVIRLPRDRRCIS